ncbi:MAG: UDP-4-amino-4,6-dideoxy-N-acetyl-beta-L-altrosamine transaminase [Verrucomicrobiales bacterium]|nr:UDP-4-amino-4,6-dideoxy-N-acetyl-beta-L-altrosamine transaminase [Verrucomicrobiales bacterium]
MIPYGKQSVSEEDIEAVVDALRSDFLTQGPVVERFEQEFAEVCGAKYAVACCNGTAALHLAMLAAGVKAGDRVVTSPITFVASANCAAYVGAEPYFADIDPISHCLSPQALERTWKPGTRAVVAVDFAGQPAEMPGIAEVARNNGAVVIEDACHAVGGRFTVDGREHRIGGHQWADITTFSFHPVKTLTTGEGGMLVTDNKEYADAAKLYRSHGITRSAGCWTGPLQPEAPEVGVAYYEMQALGFNYRLSDIHAALGVSQLKRLPGFIERRQKLVERYNQAFREQPNLTIPKVADWLSGNSNSLSWHLYVLLFEFERTGKSREEVILKLRDKGVGTQVHYIPVHKQPYYFNRDNEAALPVAEKFYSQALSLPLYPTMTEADQSRVIDEVLGIVSESS